MTSSAAERPGIRSGISSFTLHLLAMGLMLCDHLWATLLGDITWLAYLGRLAFPIFAFLAVEGFFHTKNLKKYRKRLLLFALISEIPFNLMMSGMFFYPLHQNVLWTFLLGSFAMSLLEKQRNRGALLRLIVSLVVVFAFYLLGILCFVD